MQENEQAMGWALPFRPSGVSWIISSHATQNQRVGQLKKLSRKREGQQLAEIPVHKP
jgi:hypothetical protein